MAPLLSTKLYFPTARPNLVSRPRLVERFSNGLKGPLTLISAPPGYGKTTLISEWRLGPGEAYPVAWLSLEGSDNDPALFLTYLAAALDAVRRGIQDPVLPLLQSPQPPPIESILILLVNELSLISQDFALVLDDYYAITNQAIHQGLSFLLEHLPPQMHLVILTREDPPLPLPKLRVRSQLTEIRAGDLRFAQDEARDFFEQTMGLDLPDEAAGILLDRTEGWVAGLQMAGLALQAIPAGHESQDAREFITAFRGDDRYVMDYLMDEVIRRQPQEIQSFLLDTAILDRLCAGLCDALMADRGSGDGELDLEILSPTSQSPIPSSDSQQILEYLERTNLFLLPLDNKREWFRYHHLFADLLHYRLQRKYPAHLAALHRRAARWHARAGNPEEAMKHALAASDSMLAASLAEQYLLYMIGGSRIVTFLNWIRRIPEEIVIQRAYLCVGAGWANAIICETDIAGRYVKAGVAALSQYEPVQNRPDGRWITPEEVAGQLAAIRAYIERLRGDFPAAIEQSQQALQALPVEASAVRAIVALNLGLLLMESGEPAEANRLFSEAFDAAEKSGENLFIAITALSLLGSMASQKGNLGEAERYFQRAIRLGTASEERPLPIPAIAYAHGGLLAVHYQRNELNAAAQHLEKAARLVDQLGQQESIAMVQIYHSLLAQSQGEFSLADEWLRKAEEQLRENPAREGIQTEFTIARSQLLLATGDIPGAKRFLEAQAVKAGELSELQKAAGLRTDHMNLQGTRLAEHLLLARVLLAEGAVDQAAELLERVRELAETRGNLAVQLEALLFAALAASQRRGGTSQASLYLKQALDLASKERFARPFLNAGEPLVKLLRQAIIQDIQPAFAQQLLVALKDQERRQVGGKLQAGDRRSVEGALVAPAGVSASNLVEPLTERERQVLRLLAAGLSSTEVAEELVLSVSTARSYIKRLYGKLDAHSREEAIEKGREFGMI